MKRLTSILLLALLFPLASPFHAAWAVQDNPAEQCADGVQFFLAGQIAEAQPLLEAGFAGRENAKFADHDDLGICALALGLLRTQTGEYSGALDAYAVAMNIFQASNNRAFEGTTLTNIGEVYRLQSRWAEALESFQKALAIHREMADKWSEAEALNKIGVVYEAQGRYEKALENLQQARNIWQEVEDRSREGVTLNNIGSVFTSQGRYVEALETYQQALIIRREMEDWVGEGVTLTNIGIVYDAQGYFSKALENHHQALAIFQETGAQTAAGETHNNIGKVHRVTGNYDQAMEHYRQALVIFQQLGNRADEGAVFDNIGILYQFQGRYAEALASLQQALNIAQELGDRSGEGHILNNIGEVYRAQGRHAKALATFQQALTIIQEIGDRLTEGTILNNIGGVYQAQGDYDAALTSFQQALDAYQAIENRPGEGTILNSIGATYEAQGRPAEALLNLQQALAILQEVGDQDGIAATLNNIGLAYQTQGRYDEALSSLQQALTVRQQVGDRDGEGATLNNIGFIYQVQERPTEALKAYRQAMDVLEEIRAGAGSEQSRASFIAQFAKLYNRTIDLLHQQNKNEAAFIITERGRARSFLDSLSTGQVQLNDDAAVGLLVQEREIYAQRQVIQDNLTRAKAAISVDPAVISDLESQLTETQAAYEKIQTAITERSEQLAALIPGRSAEHILSVAEVQNQLNEQTTLISYWSLNDKILAFLITQDDFQAIPLEVSQEALTQQIISFRDFANVTEAHLDSAVTLYQWLLEPLRPQLKTPHLVIIPHNILHYLPFAALTDGERYLIDDYAITTLPSASALPFIQENAAQTAVGGQRSTVVLGKPAIGEYDTVASLAIDEGQYQGLLRLLSFARQEAKTIAKLYGVEPLIGENATESAVWQQVSEANILHLAAHGVFNPVAPLNSLIALSPDDENDGWLTVGEVYGLDLNNTDLIVLSACETNLGDLSEGDELVGLTRAFIFAGTPSILTSLWNVDDEATSLLMERFYTHLKGGMGKAEALRQAQLETREEYPNPYYWSAFVLSGYPGGTTGEAVISDGTPPSTVEAATVPVEETPRAEETPAPTKGGGLCLAGALILALSVGIVFIANRRILL